jgi:head-tail adaptor
MPDKFGAGQMRDLMSFQSREVVNDGYGNKVAGGWVERFRDNAKITNLRGGENVIASRLESRNVALMQVRSSQQIADVTPQWRVVDVRRGTEFNIREIHQDRTTALYEMMIESGVAT